jgi:holo-[acyl-carrier protein] synthase
VIRGIGVDVVDLARFVRQIERTPRLVPRLFTENERGLPAHSLAARFAAKEALIKALGDSAGITWQEMEVTTDAGGNPEFRLHGKAVEAMAARQITSVHVTMTHDAGVAVAFVVAEGF